ncbi:lanC-like protein 2 [Xenia sp. Carnegie-2017]|uniref:lanC-like protein 2 n=1 Tax=Xenia sp. Carnegie-2017 TaxID=2897299 RepID=UPI001F04D1E6|nr:lanC-like protein 2 [Xenia sp. Carnegie-2017]
MSGKREFENPYSDEISGKLVENSGKVCQPLELRLRHNIEKYLNHLHNGLKYSNPHDYSVYTGSAGIALLYLHVASTVLSQNVGEQTRLLTKATDIIEGDLRRLSRRRVTFLCGDSGILSIAAVLYAKLGQKQKSDECLSALCSLHRDIGDDLSLPDELLYGKAGYLYSLLFVKTHLGKDQLLDHIAEKVASAMLHSGVSLAQKKHTTSPLMYAWHGKYYVGAAHGIAGILYMLLQLHPYSHAVKEHINEIQGSIDYLLTVRFPSGNYPSSFENEKDRLIHWCHGAPGVVFLMLKAFQVFEEKRYLDAAISCGEVVWKRGLLKKGYGICHGVSGNAYTFLALYKHTENELYLHRALKFAEWTFSYGEHDCRTPDAPFSLFEGLAGTIYFWSDLLDTKKSRFPAFELG